MQRNPPLLFLTRFSPAIDKEIRVRQIKTWSRDNPVLLFLHSGLNLPGHQVILQAARPTAKSIKVVPSLVLHDHTLTWRPAVAAWCAQYLG